MNAELWKPVVFDGFEGCYEVSSWGRVRSLDRVVCFSDGRTPFRPGRILSPRATVDGHVQVLLCKNGRRRQVGIHRLVAKAFLGEPPPGVIYCCHNDGDPTNNHVENLRWDTPHGNSIDTVKHGRNKNSIKSHCKYGHPLDEENTYRWFRNDGRVARGCRQCRARLDKEWKLRQKQGSG